jgi:hypothetical protein
MQLENWDKATPAACKELKQFINFALDTNAFRLCIEQKFNKAIMLMVYSVSDWAGDKCDSLYFVSHHVLILCKTEL